MSEALYELGEKLSAAIQAGDAKEASNLVHQLSTMKLKLDINIKKEEVEQRNKEQEFSVRIHVEDRFSDGCYFNLLVKSCDTIQDLKKKVMLKYNFPMEVQRWIIGKKVPENETKLYQCGVRGPGHTLFLYLVTARSVGLTKQDYEARRQALQLGIPLQNQQLYQSGLSSPVQKESPDSQWTLPVSSPEGQSQLYSNSPSPILDSSPVLGMGEVDQSYSTYGPARQTSKRSLSSGSSLLQDMLLAPNLSGLAGSEGRPKQLSSEGAASVVGQWDSGINSPGRTFSVNNYRTPPRSPSPEPVRAGWECPTCTYINLPTWPGCEMCSASRPPGYKIPAGYQMTPEELQLLENEQHLEKMTREAEEEVALANYQQLMATDNFDLIANTELFQCQICFDDINIGEGIVLRECLHMFCRECLTQAVRLCEDAVIKCPFQDDLYSCQCMLQEREVRALVPEVVYLRFLQRGLDQAESQTANAYHCKTADCHGWCVYEDLVNFFQCPVCERENCLTCKAIHEGQNCQQYQDDLKLRASNNAAAKQTAELLQKLVADGEAMHCPQCQVIVQKKGGCDWIKCSICKTEICWVTKGPRWGPKGEGDVSAGCRCRINGNKCHPNCINCH